jgi:[ribosomal protein S5]-alanine N-acetyltransferase
VSLMIATLRMRLRALTLPMAEAIAEDRRRLERLVDAHVPDAWPPVDTAGFITSFGERLRADPAQLGWGPWLLVLDVERTLVGDAGFTGKPNDDGIAEIGYGVLPAFQRQGLATEAGEALIRWAFEHGARAVVAQCDANNVASVRVLEKLGMRSTGRAGNRLSWRVEKD